jgi:hypothetical protein
MTLESSEEQIPSTPIRSLGAIACAVVMWSIFWFLTTEAGRQFNEDVFGRYYTLGALMMMGTYAVIGFSLFGGGIFLTWRAIANEERPAFFPRLALIVNLAAPVAWLLFAYL